MKNALWFVLGVTGGFIAAHLVNKDPRGQELLAEVDARITEFSDRMADAYRAQEAKIEGLVADTRDFAADASETAKEIVGDIVDDVADAAERAVKPND